MKYNKNLINVTILVGVMLGSSASKATAVGGKYFNGPYLDVGTGISQQRYNITGKGSNSTVRSNITAGYSGILDSQAYVAGEVYLGVTQTLNRKLHSGTDLDDISKTKVVGRNNSVGALLKAGPVISPTTAIYGLIGPEISGFKVKTTVRGNEPRHKSSMKVGLALGAGFTSYITENITYGLTFTHTMYNHVTSPNLKGVISDIGSGTLRTDNRKLKVHSNSLLVDVAYRF